ncbi:hypothetical protein EKN06_08820 [Croceicoccus ponticola]|uniref:Uncharacterized protein n=1 Tax=Croceicoccus ponticola TaxID=2217664 RepID=A0A437GXD8_9SPHN|nr:hypothetical protein [Croceicoccus ponticola]RVQ67029.1 hypothetical protein EKN06_08820 [Croceicoccus ponticola]
MAVAILAFSYLLYRTASDQQGAIALNARHNAEVASRQTAAEIKANCQTARVAPERVDCENSAYQQAEATEREIEDLKAQQIMALWTRYMGLAAIVGTTFGILGVGLVFVTFQETRRTAEIAEKNFQAFAKIEAGAVIVKFAATPTFFRENGKMWMRFGLKCVNIGRSAVAVGAVEIEGLDKAYYGFISKIDGDEPFGGTNKICVDGKDLIRGYIEYSNQVEMSTRRRFVMRLTLADIPGGCKVSLFTGGILRKGDPNYDKPFYKH